MDKITLQNMKFLGYHGCEAYEQQYGQVFEVDLDLLVDAKLPGDTDCLTDAVDYVSVFQSVKQVVEQERHNLLERVAQRITEQVLQVSGVAAVTVRIRKPAVPLKGVLDWVQLEISRERPL